MLWVVYVRSDSTNYTSSPIGFGNRLAEGKQKAKPQVGVEFWKVCSAEHQTLGKSTAHLKTKNPKGHLMSQITSYQKALRLIEDIVSGARENI